MKKLIVLSLILLVSLVPLWAEVETYEIDPVHSSVIFSAKHFNVGYFYGRFNQIEGTIRFDRENHQNSSVEITIPVKSIDTANQKRDDHLKGPDFFDAKQFPNITFKSSEIKVLRDKVFEVRGPLTLHGVTKEITLRVDLTGEGKDPWGNYRIGFWTQKTIKRSEFGMSYMLEGISDKVDLIVSVEAIKK